MKIRRLIFLIAFLSVLGVIFINGFGALWKMHVENLFRLYVQKPIPESVDMIQIDKPKSHGGYGYVFRFNIKRDDFEIIRKSRSFRNVLAISYVNGEGLSWFWSDLDFTKTEAGMSFSIYSIVHKPSWYDLPTWDNPEAYALRNVDNNNNKDIQVLLYNNNLGMAYFITFQRYLGTPY